MPENMVLYIIFLFQIILISYYFSGKVIRRLRYVLDNYPPSEYPKLYPLPVPAIEQGIQIYKVMNAVILGVGLAMVVYGIVWPSAEMLHWDNQSVLILYFFIQFLPVIFLEISNAQYLKLMRKANTRKLRKAELHPRRLFDFVSPGLVGLAIVTYVAFVMLVVYIMRAPFPGFAGYWNIVFVTLLNLFYAGVIMKHIYGKKKNPYQAHEDRMRQTGLIVKQMVIISIMGTLFLVILLILPGLELRHLTDILTSLYLQLCAVLAFQGLRIDSVNFEVYRAETGQDSPKEGNPNPTLAT